MRVSAPLNGMISYELALAGIADKTDEVARLRDQGLDREARIVERQIADKRREIQRLVSIYNLPDV